jgi:hypothetical protein
MHENGIARRRSKRAVPVFRDHVCDGAERSRGHDSVDTGRQPADRHRGGSSSASERCAGSALPASTRSASPGRSASDAPTQRTNEESRRGLTPRRDFHLSDGSGEIRTHGTLSRTHTFQACALNHSATDPNTAPASRYNEPSALTAPSADPARSMIVPKLPQADRVRFELTIPLRVRRFSRPLSHLSRGSNIS